MIALSLGESSNYTLQYNLYPQIRSDFCALWLKNASRDALETLFDAAVFEEHLALVLEGIDNVNLEREITELLMTCQVVPEEEGRATALVRVT